MGSPVKEYMPLTSTERSRKNRLKDPEEYRRKQREWYAANPDKTAKYRQTRKERDPDCANRWAKKYRENNRSKMSKASAAWAKKNRERVNARNRELHASSPRKRVERSLRLRLYAYIRKSGFQKTNSAPSLIGCSVEFLVRYLSDRFTHKMSWDNYGEVWEIDHVMPCSSFDLCDPKAQLACFHYSNLRPLLKAHNRRKHAKVLPVFQPELI